MIKHMGIYVSNLKIMENFYEKTFDMFFVCRNQEFSHPLMNDLLQSSNCRVRISKLITEYGKKTGVGDMIELIEIEKKSVINCLKYSMIWENSHVAFEVCNLEKTIEKIISYGGKQKTEIYNMGNGNLCCFCLDPENNWLELIGKL